MASDELLDDRYCFPGQKCAEDSADSDSVESMEDCKGEDYGGCQTAEIKGCLDDFVIFFTIPDKSRGKISVGMIGSIQLLARQIPKHTSRNPARK